MPEERQFKIITHRQKFSVSVTLLELHGDLEGRAVQQFAKVLLDIAEGLNPYVILNLKNLTFVTSQGLATIVRAAKRLSSLRSGKLVLCQINPNLEMLFEMLDPRIGILSFMTEEGALNEFSSIEAEF